jgi:hypothetical protein
VIDFRLRRRYGFGELEEVLFEGQPWIIRPEAANGGRRLRLLMLDSDHITLMGKTGRVKITIRYQIMTR